ncbi:hypothetical protein BKH46_05675 [Helicobacter sp. 12S02634-8]|uniref:UpaP162 family type II restriction enzyme n=1 Tax=Helicobacter sp. 12S02634-8 TaxID=1476199 RepID=UPI000BC38A88|nr:hypothetical protein [Helicobacter sp. 12S02634-8]PAF46930.1 hypothetical protein BKH46_05675 [Helicobacter sp. 12S02634-8]
MNQYAHHCRWVKDKITEFATTIFKVYGNELVLKLEDYNLLSNENNCLESSTALGFIIEEFLISKLEVFTQDNKDFCIKRAIDNTAINHSYDCYCKYKDILFMINIKTEKNSSNNNAISAINILHNDYCSDKEQIKAYLVFKVYYKYGLSRRKQERALIIQNIDTFYLEEIDFSAGHKQDYRNWSGVFKGQSGRLQISKKFKQDNQVDFQKISYEITYNFIQGIFESC